MKTLIAGMLAVLTLGGCVAVPYPAEPAYGYYYAPPPAAFSFRYDYHRGYYGPRYYRR